MRKSGRIGRLIATLALAVGAFAAASPGVATAASCAQPTHVWIVTDAGGIPPGGFAVPGSAGLTFAGVTAPGWGVLFQYYTLNDQFIYNNFEGYAGSNCVLNQRTHQASFIPFVGTMKVYALYHAWENDSNVFQFLGTFTKTS